MGLVWVFGPRWSRSFQCKLLLRNQGCPRHVIHPLPLPLNHFLPDLAKDALLNACARWLLDCQAHYYHCHLHCCLLHPSQILRWLGALLPWCQFPVPYYPRLLLAECILHLECSTYPIQISRSLHPCNYVDSCHCVWWCLLRMARSLVLVGWFLCTFNRNRCNYFYLRTFLVCGVLLTPLQCARIQKGGYTIHSYFGINLYCLFDMVSYGFQL